MKNINLKNMTAKEIYNGGKEWKEFDFKKGLDELIKKDENGRFIYYAGMDWKEFDYERGFEELIKKDKEGWLIYLAGLEWKEFDYEKGLDGLIKQNKNSHYIYLAKKEWPKGIEQSKKEIQKLRDTSTKLPRKSFKLKEAIEEDLSKKKPLDIYLDGRNKRFFNFNEGLRELIRKDKTGEYIYFAGRDWKNFNYEKGFEELIKKDNNGWYIYLAGIEWKNFDYNKGMKALKEKNKKTINYLNLAKKYWYKGIKKMKKTNIDKIIREVSAEIVGDKIPGNRVFDVQGNVIPIEQLKDSESLDLLRAIKAQLVRTGLISKFKNDNLKDIDIKPYKKNEYLLTPDVGDKKYLYNVSTGKIKEI